MISTLNNNVNRISGLASGLDTETLVKQLTSVTQTRIDSAGQQKQVLEWKQDSYREILNRLVSFNNTYFGSGSLSLTIGDSIGQMTATSTNSQYVTALGSSRSGAQSILFEDIVSLASTAKTTGSHSVSGALTSEIDPLLISMLGGKSMKVTVDGISKTVTFSDKSYESAEDVAEELNQLLKKSFGNGKVQVEADGNALRLDAGTSKITLSVTGEENGEAATYLGFTSGSSNRISLNTKLGELNLATALEGEELSCTINGTSFTFSRENTLNQIISTINNSKAGVKMSYSSLNDTFMLTSSETGSAAAIDFGDDEGNLLSSLLGAGAFTAGTDAVVRVGLNGDSGEENLITLVRSSNTFEIDGTTYTLKGMAEGNGKENVTVSTSYDVDNMAQKITSFVNAYNELIGFINDKLNETVYRGFPPLTDTQKESLSEEEQKQWTEKAKSGLLRKDPALQQIVDAMRSALYDGVASLGEAGKSLGLLLTDVGIATKSYSDYGKLAVNETDLRKALMEQPEQVLALFTQKSSIAYSQYNSDANKKLRYEQSGLMWRLSDIVQNNLSKVGKKGALVELVGSPDNNFIGLTEYGKKIRAIESTIGDLNIKILDQQNRYWTKFTAMEKMLNNLNSQSSWLMAQLPSQ